MENSVKFFIYSQNTNDFTKSFEKMIKKMKNKPVLTIGEAFSKKIKENYSKVVYYVSLREVTISNLTTDGWIWVATFYHHENIKAVNNADLFANMPSKFGMQYTICDYCGRNESRRKESFVIYNQNTKEWKQIGKTCVEKIFGCEYLAKFMAKLYSTTQDFGLSFDDYKGGSWSAPNHYLQEGLQIDLVLQYVQAYRKDHKMWQKADYYDGVKHRGTTHYLNDFIDDEELPVNAQLNKNVFEFVETLDDSNDFCSGIKDSFKANFLPRYEIYKLFFAVKMYEESISTYLDKLDDLGIKRGEKRAIVGTIKESSSYFDNWLGCQVYSFTIQEDNTNLIYTKKSNRSDIFDSYKDGDKVKFNSLVKSISKEEEIITLGGKLSKYKK